MERREETIGTIVGIEWEMMDKVQNCGGGPTARMTGRPSA